MQINSSIEESRKIGVNLGVLFQGNLLFNLQSSSSIRDTYWLQVCNEYTDTKMTEIFSESVSVGSFILELH